MSGKDDVMTKPYRILEMVKKIEKLMDRYGGPNAQLVIGEA